VSFNVLNRKAHHWASFAATLPILVIIASGLLLQMKKHWTWVQPVEHRGTATEPRISLDQVLSSVQSVPELRATTWNDVDRLDLRPGRGVVKVSLKSRWEVQVDLGSGRVLQTAYRRSDLIESIHDGSIFLGDWTKLGIFLPAGIVLLFLWVSGMWMVWVPYAGKRRRRKIAHPRAAAIALLLAGAAAAALAAQELRVTPVLGHWEHKTENGDAVVVADATKWEAAKSPVGFPLATVPGVTFSNGTLRVKFKLVSGGDDRIAGLAFNVTPTNEYYFARYNTKDGNVAIWQFTKGERVRLAEGKEHLQLPLNTWHDLEVTVAGRQVTALVNGKLRLTHELPVTVNGGVGFWTKRDSVTEFKSFNVAAKGEGRNPGR
jgi:hypothetical protein